MAIYTRTGDAGTTSLFTGQRVSKTHPRVEAYGTLDELNAMLSLCVCAVAEEEQRTLLEALQQHIFWFSAELASDSEQPSPGKRYISSEEIALLEQTIDREMARVPALHQFVLPGRCEAASRLHLARTVALHSVPVLGVNLGSLGFMSELEVNELDRLRDLAQGRFTVESRMMLDVSVLREGRQVYNNIALNDAVVSKGSIARVVRLDIFTEEGRLTKVGGDGIIVSTPTGSTGYSMAAGGPIVEPTAKNLLLTPICPHSTRSSSYVLSPEHVITVEAADANRKFVYLSVDGGKAFSLKNGDQVRVSTSKYTTRLVRLSKKSFCEILDKKMGTEASKK